MIRRAAEADIPAIAAIERACFSAPWSASAVADSLASPFAVFFCHTDIIIKEEIAVTGYGGMYLLSGEADITNIAVLPAHRRRGIAAALLSAMFDHCRAANISALHLEVRSGNTAARALYEKYGFSADGIRRGYYRAPKEDAILMTKRFE